MDFKNVLVCCDEIDFIPNECLCGCGVGANSNYPSGKLFSSDIQKLNYEKKKKYRLFMNQSHLARYRKQRK